MHDVILMQEVETLHYILEDVSHDALCENDVELRGKFVQAALATFVLDERSLPPDAVYLLRSMRCRT